jgi:hypothetical protein
MFVLNFVAVQRDYPGHWNSSILLRDNNSAYRLMDE